MRSWSRWDSRDGYVSVSGWTSASRVRATELLQRMSDAGVKTFLCTDIAKDGTLDGPDYELMSELVEIAGKGVIAAGGVASVGHVRGLARTGVGGVVDLERRCNTGDIDPEWRRRSRQAGWTADADEENHTLPRRGCRACRQGYQLHRNQRRRRPGQAVFVL